MPLVKVKEKFQITLPAELREVLHLAVGDLLEATIQGQTIVLKPKDVVDKPRHHFRYIYGEVIGSDLAYMTLTSSQAV